MSRDRVAPTAALQIEELTREVDTLRASVAERDARLAAQDEEIALLRGMAEAPRPVGDAVWVVKSHRIMHNDVEYKRGDAMPFDPKNPPPGCNGFIEGRHYERARVIVRNAS